MADKTQQNTEEKNISPKSKSRFSVKRLAPRTRAARALAICSVILLIGSLSYAAYEQFRNKDIIIGDTRITPKDIEDYTKQVENYTKRYKVDFGSSARQTAIDDLVLNASLKYEAQKLSIKINETDTDKALAQKYLAYKSKEAYQRAVKNDPARKLLETRAQNDVYKEKLSDTVLAKKDLFMVGITYDSPYFTNAANAQELRDQAKKTLQDTYLPLFKKGETKEEIASKVEINYMDPNINASNPQPFFERAVTYSQIVEDYNSANPYFNDEQVGRYKTLPGIVSTDSKIQKLHNKGDYTDVFVSKAGFIGILRLEDKTKGKYDTWDQFLEVYKNEYAKNIVRRENVQKNVAILYNKVASSVQAAFAYVGIKITPKVAAESCSSEHNIRFGVVARDVQTNALIAGARVNEKRGATGCANENGQYPINQTAVTNTSGRVWLYDNCWNPEPVWTLVDPPKPAGAKSIDFVGIVVTDKNGNRNVPVSENSQPGQENTPKQGWPKWMSNIINTTGTMHIDAMYLITPPPEQPKDWRLDVDTQLQVENGSWVQPRESNPVKVSKGKTVRFRYQITNTGDVRSSDFMRKINITGRDGSWTPQSGLNKGQVITNPSDLSITSIKIPNSAKKGDQYCGRGWADRKSNTDSADNQGNRVCVEVLGTGEPEPKPCNYASGWLPNPDTALCGTWNLTPASGFAPGSGPFVEQGGVVNFAHSVTNTGNEHGTQTAPGISRCVAVGNNCIASYRSDIAPGTFGVPASEIPPFQTDGNTPLGTRYCQAYSVFPGAKGSSDAKTSAEVCSVVVGGKTYLAVDAASRTASEPGERVDFKGSLNTNSYTNGGTTYPGYDVACGYEITAYFPYGGTERVANGTCTSRIDSDGPKPVVDYPYTRTDPVGTKVCLSMNIGPANGNWNLITGFPSGQSCVDIVAKPYMKIVGGDVAAGQCGSGNSMIASWNKLSNPSNQSGDGNLGAGATYAAFAQGMINSFASGQNITREANYGYSPSNLSFANVNTSPSTGNFGGGFAGTPCPPAYYGTKPSNPADITAWPGMGSAVGALGSKVYSVTSTASPTTIGGATISANTDIRLYVDGDVILNGDIKANYTGAIDASQMPNFTLIVRGNIYIQPGVKELYGTYVAEGGRGNIYTCSNGTNPINATNYTLNPPAAPTNPYAQCGNQLTFTGSVVARRIALLRTFGSLYQDTGVATGAARSAEVFKYNPLSWIFSVVGPTTSHDDTAESFTSQPPVL